LGEYAFDFGFLLVPDQEKQLVGVFGSQMGRQQPNAAQVKTSLGYGFEDLGKLTGRTRRMNSIASRILREVKLLHAIDEHRRISGCCIQRSHIDFGDMSEQHGRRSAVLIEQRGQSLKKGSVAELGQIV